MKEYTLRIKNDRLAENIIALIGKIKEIEIFELSSEKKSPKKSKIQKILDNPYDVKNFRIYKRPRLLMKFVLI
jgi:hypothetical protein